MQATIVGLVQSMSLLSGDVQNSITLQLGDGGLISASVDEATVVRITELFVRQGTPAASAAVARAIDPPEVAPPVIQQPEIAQQRFPMRIEDDVDAEAYEGDTTFGGDYSDAAATEAVNGRLALAGRGASSISGMAELEGENLHKAAADLRNQGMPTPDWDAQATPTPKRRVSVTTDDWGNPVLRGSNLVDTSLLVGGLGAEEGDTGQL